MKLPGNAIVKVSACGIFAEPTFKSEMVNQALLNEEVIISDKKDNWYKIKLRYDEYSGWIHEMYLEDPNDDNAGLDKDYVSQIKNPIAFQACQMLGKPYVWGGRSFQGYDCSGLVQTSMNLCGISFPRDAKDQAISNLLYEVELKNAHEGDLVFFEKDKAVNHVAIVISLIFDRSELLLEVVHASGSVRISRIKFELKDLVYGTVDNNLEKEKIKLHKIMRLKEDV